MKFQKKPAPGSPGELPAVLPPGMAIEMWPIDRPIPYAKNARRWSDRAIAVVASSVREFGFRQPIVVDGKDVIAIGHLRLAAAKSLGLAEVPVHVARDLTPTQIRGLRIADNRSAQEASWDFDLLGPELLDLKALDFDLGLTGFDSAEIDELLIKAGLTDGLTDEDAVPEPPEVPVTIAGDLWVMGGHRVLCGDSTSIDAAQRLCGADGVDMLFTDPPYDLHPTMKPVELAEIAVNNSSRAGDVVLDLFGGSGSTLIACEKTGRRARLMELDPKYVDVIVNRWQEFTGQEATLEGTDRTFAELKAERLPAPVAA